ncbi:MAG: TIGR00730 family Rossman fold protein [Spirochaetes bacterium]|nr:TIGR00730 family Rossman fold protein [Spirochaetota bacterium]
MKRLCVYCGSSLGTDTAYRRGAARLGALIAGRGLELVYGGAVMGLMGTLAKACLEAGGRVTGVIPERLVGMGVVKEDLQELILVRDMHERKRVMMELSDAFIAMPGGPGTLEEAFEVYSWMQLGMHEKPLGLFNLLGFYDPLMAFLQGVSAAGFLRPGHLEYLIVEGDPAVLLDRIEGFRFRALGKWEDMAAHRV